MRGLNHRWWCWRWGLETQVRKQEGRSSNDLELKTSGVGCVCLQCCGMAKASPGDLISSALAEFVFVWILASCETAGDTGSATASTACQTNGCRNFRA
jgi:hypothetical protein